MFRSVSTGCERPHYWVVCDDRTCGMQVQGDVDVSSPEEIQNSHKAFVRHLNEKGWAIGLDAQICPAHAKALLDIAQAATKPKQNLVSIASKSALDRLDRIHSNCGSGSGNSGGPPFGGKAS